MTDSRVIRIERFNSWQQLKKAALRYESQGIESEVRGWEDMRANKLTIYGDHIDSR